MDTIHCEHDHHASQGSAVAGRIIFSSLTVTTFLALAFLSKSWAQFSTNAPQEGPKLTPLPHPDIAKPAMLEPAVATWIIVLAVAGLAGLLALFVWLLFRKRPASIPVQPPPLTLALEQMEKLRAQSDRLPPSELAHQVSVILRDYQFGRYSLPAPYRTSEELYGDPSTVQRAELKQRFGPIAAIYDRLEFAPLPVTPAESLDLIESAVQALREEKRYQDPRVPATAPPPSLTEPAAP